MKNDTEVVQGRVVTTTRKAIFLDVSGYIDCYWIPKSQIIDCDTDLDELKAEDEVELEIKKWVMNDWEEE